MPAHTRHSFPDKVVSKIAERSAYICSNPACHRVTIGPDSAAAHKSIKTGEAAHICAASPGGSRYDMSQTEAERRGIGNAIWLCGACADLVDKNNGHSYPAEHLRKWKRDHEALMKECLEGGKRIVLQFLPHRPDEGIALKLLHILEDKGALYLPYDQENPKRVADSLKELRTTLTSLRSQVAPDSPLDVILDSIVRACRHYMNTTPDHPDLRELNFSLGAVRKVIGLNVGELFKHYKLPASSELQSIVPQ
ncbi:hypothetical protein DY262_16815 [Hydrogenophaga borbori]|uniref:HNH endonuclease n=1 Tax=Hydrogenophaga borbori TaxID=2294117 RepID=A0A372EG67_9BURK|nr:hypothetical protein [Hydrogenophaga borbori]RFP77416.1 hypothetical protein DY262_16815 [Hydrogenophaga borbori]